MTDNLYFWEKKYTPFVLHEALLELGKFYPIKENIGKYEIKFIISENEDISIVKKENVFEIHYREKITFAMRGLGMVLANNIQNGSLDFKSFGIMYDCSRQAVPTVNYLKEWLRQLALYGCNMLMLYTEDVFILPDVAEFGYMRGAYSSEEIKEVDNYAATFDIEIVPCIQTLGHLAQFLKWPSSRDVKDTSTVLLIDEEKTYELIDKMVKFWSDNVRSKRIHIGMDEAHDLGRGRYYDIHGNNDKFEIFTKHLNRVEAICKSYKMETMIWSDMYFRMGNPDSLYYNKATVIPEYIKNKIPKDINLVYWDYYHAETEFYDLWISRHEKDLGKKPLAATGAWCWNRMWYDHKKTVATAFPFLKAAQKAKLDMFLITLWGNDGASCNFDSTLAGIAYISEHAYNKNASDKEIEKSFFAISGGNYNIVTRASDLQFDFNNQLPNIGNTPLALWDDPLYGMAYREFERQNHDFPQKIIDSMNSLVDELKPYINEKNGGDIFYAWQTAQIISKKFKMYKELRFALKDMDYEKIKVILNDIPEMIKLLENFFYTFRKQWLKGHKSFGIDDCQTRIFGQIGRYYELKIRLEETLDKKQNLLPELADFPAVEAPHSWYPQMTLSAGIMV